MSCFTHKGTIAPSSSPVFSSLPDHNGCPSEYDSTADYGASDKVSVPITTDHSVVYECDSDFHNSKWCNQYEPGNDWAMGWKLIGYCEGTIAPTSSPNFSSLNEVGDGCPKPYNVATTYEAGDQVSVFFSNDSSNAIIFECKTWPNGAYCNAGSEFSPESDNANMGWNLKGYCQGTIAPTAAPIVYTPAAKCRWYNGTEPITIDNWAESSLSTYVSGTRVRKENRIYKCKVWPYGLWCKTAAYEPEETDVWADAWSSAGTCNGMFEPTTSPSVSPTSSPTISPSASSTSSPSASPTSSPSKSPSASTSTDWEQIGSDIDGEAAVIFQVGLYLFLVMEVLSLSVPQQMVTTVMFECINGTIHPGSSLALILMEKQLVIS